MTAERAFATRDRLVRTVGAIGGVTEIEELIRIETSCVVTTPGRSAVATGPKCTAARAASGDA